MNLIQNKVQLQNLKCTFLRTKQYKTEEAPGKSLCQYIHYFMFHKHLL